MSDFERLNYQDGRFVLIEAPSMARASLVRAYHLELLNLVRQFDQYYMAEADAVLFAEFGYYYQAIADQLQPSIDVSQLQPVSRHTFFVSGPVQTDPTNPKQKIVGMPLLERLMGYAPVAGATPSTATSPALTTGNLALDVLAGLLVVQAPNVPWLVEHYSPEQLMHVLNHVAALHQGEEAVSEAQHQKDREWEAQNQDAIAASFRQQGATAPLAFLG